MDTKKNSGTTVAADRALNDELYGAWTEHHRPIYAKTACLVGIAVMALLIPIDFANFGPVQAMAYVPYRAAFLVYLLVNLALLHSAKNGLRKNVFQSKRLMNLMFFTPPLICNILYGYFLLTVPETHHTPVILGNLMVAFFSSFLLHCFWKEQYLLNGLSVLTLLGLAVAFPSFQSDAIQLSICHLSSFVVLHFFRRKFFSAMAERYRSLRALVPSVVAKRMTVTNGDISTDAAFKPRERYAAFLSSDWRNYQDLATKTSAEVVSKLFETYYDVVFAALEKAVPSGTYYADWTADELSIIFYSDTDDKDQVLRDAATFANTLATTIPAIVEKECGIPLIFDIGLACGFGILGLQGPKQRKKTTITAEFAGTAKRLETEAKEIRTAAIEKNASPIVMMDDSIRIAATRLGLLATENGAQVVARTKNISGQTFFKWQMPSKPAAKALHLVQTLREPAAEATAFSDNEPDQWNGAAAS